MAEKYLRDLAALMARLSPGVPGRCVLEFKHFFGGAAVYADGHICMTRTPVGLALKLPEDACEALFAAGGTPLRYFAKAPVKKQYVVVPEGIAGDVARLKPWVEAAIGYARGPADAGSR